MSGITLTEVDDATIATPASGKVTVFFDDALGPAYKDDAGGVHELEGADGELSYTNHGNAGAAEAIDWTTNVHRLVLDAACTLTFSNVPASGTPGIVELIITQDGTGGRTITWPAAVTWGVAGAPVLQVAASAVDVIHLQSVDGGTTVYGSIPSRSGPAGGAVSIDYLFSATTTDADPGAGLMRLDNATGTSATKIRVDLVDRLGTTQTAVIDSLDDSTNTVKGHIRLFKSDDPSKWLLFTLSAVDSSSGYRNITVTNVAGSSASPFAGGDPITLAFTRAGDAGSGTSFTHTTQGTTGMGSSFTTTAATIYLKKITMATAGLITAIVAGIKGDAATGTGLSVAIYSDVAGAATNVIAVGAPLQRASDNTLSANLGISGTARLISVPISYWAAAGDYWLAVMPKGANTSDAFLAFDGSGSDSTQAAHQFSDTSFIAVSTGTNNHTIYADIIR